MAEYIVVYIIFSLLFLGENFFKKYRRILFYLSFIIVVIYIAFSYSIGADWDNYYINYKYLPKIFEKNTKKILPNYINFEIGFQIYTRLVKTFVSYDLYRVISNTIDILIVYNISKYYTKRPISLIILYIPFNFFSIEVEALRQAKAICLFLYSTKYIYEKNFAKYVFINLLGATFHFTAIILLPLYFFIKNKIRMNIKRIIIILILSYLLRSVIVEIVRLSINYLPSLVKYQFYSKIQIRALSLFNIIRNLTIIIPIFFLIKNEKNLIKIDKKYFLIRNVYILYIVTMIIGEKYEIMNRFLLYFSFFYCTSIILMLSLKQYKRLLILFVLVITLRFQITYMIYPFTRNYKNIVVDQIKGQYMEVEKRFINNNKRKNADETMKKIEEKLKK